MSCRDRLAETFRTIWSSGITADLTKGRYGIYIWDNAVKACLWKGLSSQQMAWVVGWGSAQRQLYGERHAPPPRLTVAL